MKVLFVRLGFVHKKNLAGFYAMCAKSQLTEVTWVGSEAADDWDLVWIPFGAIHPSSFPNAKRIILGPHNFVFPEPPWTQVTIQDSRAFYNCLSQWNRDVCAKLGGAAGLDLVCLPFPIDESFAPRVEAKVYDCFLYCKRRNSADVEYATQVLDHLGLQYKIIQYGSYTEEEYKDTLAKCRFGVWVGCHESQGFALQEALSCNVPLVVWDVQTMGAEWNNGPVYTGDKAELKATSVPFWDHRCGILVCKEILKDGIGFMNVYWPTYRPREFVLENLSVTACCGLWGLPA
jgi:hypothetical protein